MRLYCGCTISSIIKAALVFIVFAMVIAFVNTRAIAAPKMKVSVPVDKTYSPKEKNLKKIELKAQFSVYSSAKVEVSDLDQLSELDVMFTQRKKSGFQPNYNLGFKYTNELEAFPYPNLKQAYYKFETADASMTWTVGKKLKAWSEFDRIWKLGIWEPVLKPNLLRPQRQGLTGVFLNYKSKSYKFTGFVSPLFMPDIGPQFKIIGGNLFSSNRWFQNPVGGIEYQKQNVTPVYSLQMPAISDVLLNTSMALSFHWGQKRGPWTKLSLANKPMNQMQLQFDKLQLVLEDDTVPVDIHPVVGTHSLYSLELGWKSNRFNSWVSLTQDKPNVTHVPEGFVRPAVYQNQFVALNIEHDWKILGMREWKVRWGAFKRIEKEISKAQGSADFDVNFADLRYPYEDALMVSLVMPLTFPLPILVSTKLIASPTQEGASLIADFAYKANKQLSYNFGAEIVGADNENSKDFFNQYRNNDRLYGGLSYVF